MAPNRTVTYTLRSNTSGVAGLEKYHQVLSNILAAQEKMKRQGDTISALREQVMPAIKAAEAQAQAERAAVAAKKQAGNDYTQFLKQQTAQQEALARQAAAAAKQQAAEAVAATAKIREHQAQLRLTADLAARAAREEKNRNRDGIQGIENEVRAYRNLWQSRVLSNEQVYDQQARLREQALVMLATVDKQSAAYRQLTQVAAAAQRTMDASRGINTPGGFGYGISQGITGALGQFGVTGDLLSGFVQLFASKRAAARSAASGLGEDAIAGLVSGLKSNQANVKREADLAGDSVAQAIRASLDIHSPSRVTEYLGKMAGLGFVTGVKSMQAEAKAAAAMLANSATAGMSINTSSVAVGSGVVGGNFGSGNLQASASALAELNAQLAASAPASESAGEAVEAASNAADGLGESVSGAAEHVKSLRDAHAEEEEASRRAAINEAKTALAFTATAAAISMAVAGLVASYNAAADYEKAMAGAASTTEATAEELSRLDDAARSKRLVELGINAKDAAGGIEELGSQGLSTADIVGGGLVTSLTLAKAVSTDVSKAAAIAAASTKAFGLEAKDLARVGDITTNAVNATSVKIENFSDAIAAGGMQAKNSGMNFTEFTAAISFMTDKAIGASDAGTALKTFLMALTPNSKEAAAEMKRLGFNAFDAQGNFKSLSAISENLKTSLSGLTEKQRALAVEVMFGSDGARVALAVAEQGNKGVQERINLLDRQGTMEEAARKKMEGARGEQEKFNAALENFKVTVGSAFLPMGSKMLQWAEDFIGKIDDLLRKLGQIQSPGELSATLKIDWAKDDTTTKIAKFLTGSATFLKQGVEKQADGYQRQWNDVVDNFSAAELQDQLLRRGLIQPQRTPWGIKKQMDEIWADMPKYQKMLTDAMEAAANSLKPPTTALTPTQPLPLTGAGPLLPGQTRDLGVGLPSGDSLQRMNPAFQQQLLALMGQYLAQNPQGLAPYIHEGYRSMERQAALYEQGRSKPGARVTNAKAGESIHNYGVAADIYWRDPKTGKVVSFDDPRAIEAAKALGQLATVKGLLWGGTPGWGGPVDMPHIQENISWQQARAKYGVPGTSGNQSGGSGATPPVKDFDAYVAEARRILAQIEKFSPTGSAPDGAKWASATAELKKFADQNNVAAQAVQYAQLSVKQAGKEAEKLGGVYERLQGRLKILDAQKDLGQNVIAPLQQLQKEAESAATAELKRNGAQSAKYQNLLKLAGDVAQKIKGINDASAREEKQAQTDAKQRAKEQRTLAAQAAKEARQLRFDDADATLKRMQNNDKAELESFKGSVEERLELIKRQTQAEFYAAEAVARVKRDNALRDSANQGGSNQAERDRQIKQQYTDTLTSLKTARIAAVKEGQKVVDDFWDAAIKDAERQAQGIEDHWTRMAQGAEKARDGVGELLISIEDAVNNIPDATDAQADYVRGMEMLEKAGQAAAGSVLAVKEAIEQKAATEKAAAQEASDLALLDTFGGGKAGLESLFSTFGVSGIDQLAQLDSGLAEQVKRVYKSTFALLDKELQDAIERGHAVMENAVAEFEQQSEATSVAADAAAAAINERNANTVQSLKDRGPEAFLNFLNFGKYFGDMFDRLGADGREAFMQSFDQFTPEDFSAAGEDFLSGILGKLPDDERWNALRVKLMAARDMAVAAQIEVDHLLGDIKQNPDQYGDGGRGMVSSEPPKNQFVSEAGKLFGMDKNDLANPEKVQQLRDGWAQLRADAKLTDFDLQNLNGALDKLVGGEDLPAPMGLDGWRQSLQELVGMFDEGKITADQFRGELNNGAATLEDLAKQADAAGNPRLAQAFRELAKEAKNLDPELAKLEKRLAMLQKFAGYLDQAGSIFKKFSDGSDNALSIAADWMSMNVKAFTQFESGDIAGAIMTTLNGILDIGDAIANLNPKFKQWRKNLLEIAQLEQQRMGSQFIGGTSGINGWENPYYQQLSQDAAARNQLANSKWYQRVAWSVFGGGPQVMSDELAKTKSEAAAIFNDFGSSLYGTMENALLDAIDKGDFSNVAANIGKSIDQFVQRLYVQTLLAKSNLKTLVQQLADDQAAGRDTSQDLAKIRAEMEKVTGDAAAGAGQLAGYGAGADSGSSTSGSGAASSAITGANFYVANSSKIDLFDQSILRWDGLTARIDAMYLRHEVVLDRHSAAVGRHADMLERVLRDGITLTATSSGYAGAMR